MPIIISKDGKNAEKVEQSSFGLEDKLQEYIYNNPDSIPLYDIDEDTRLFIAAREFSTKSGPIDALGFDRSGNIYVVETKLYKNPDKRTVVAQALDYGASLWRHATSFDDFLLQLSNHTEKQFDVSFQVKYAEFFELEDVDENMQNIRANLTDGVIKFVVLMDKLHDALRDLVIFVNQNSKFDLYAVELEYYKHEDFEIVIPKLFGAEVKKEVTGTKANQHTWTIEEFWSDLSNTFSPDQYAVIQPFIQSLIDKSSGLNFGRGTASGSIGIKFKQMDNKSLLTTYSNGTLSINFGNLPSPSQKESLKTLGAEYLPDLWSQPKFQRPDLENTYPSLSKSNILENISGLQKLFDTFLG